MHSTPPRDPGPPRAGGACKGTQPPSCLGQGGTQLWSPPECHLCSPQAINIAIAPNEAAGNGSRGVYITAAPPPPCWGAPPAGRGVGGQLGCGAVPPPQGPQGARATSTALGTAGAGGAWGRRGSGVPLRAWGWPGCPPHHRPRPRRGFAAQTLRAWNSKEAAPAHRHSNAGTAGGGDPPL